MARHHHRLHGPNGAPDGGDDQDWLTNCTGTLAEMDGGTAGNGLNQTVPVPAQGSVSEVDRRRCLS
jgi:hypothetical protein